MLQTQRSNQVVILKRINDENVPAIEVCHNYELNNYLLDNYLHFH